MTSYRIYLIRIKILLKSDFHHNLNLQLAKHVVLFIILYFFTYNEGKKSKWKKIYSEKKKNKTCYGGEPARNPGFGSGFGQVRIHHVTSEIYLVRPGKCLVNRATNISFLSVSLPRCMGLRALCLSLCAFGGSPAPQCLAMAAPPATWRHAGELVGLELGPLKQMN